MTTFVGVSNLRIFGEELRGRRNSQQHSDQLGVEPGLRFRRDAAQYEPRPEHDG